MSSSSQNSTSTPSGARGEQVVGAAVQRPEGEHVTPAARRVLARTAAVIAAMPEANATEASACSRAASPLSNRATVGFHRRAYTDPPPSTGRPPIAIDS